MLQECLMSDYQSKFSMENFRKEGGLKVAQKRYKDNLKASLKDFNIPTESLEQAVQDRTKWCWFIRLKAAQYKGPSFQTWLIGQKLDLQHDFFFLFISASLPWTVVFFLITPPTFVFSCLLCPLPLLICTCYCTYTSLDTGKSCILDFRPG